MSWAEVTLFIGVIWAVVAIFAIAGWVSVNSSKQENKGG